MKKKSMFAKISPPVLVVLCFALLFGAYIIINLLAMVSHSMTTTVATAVTAEESFLGTGWFVRDEVVLQETDNQDTIQYVVSSGEKVKAQAPLAVVYADPNAMQTTRQLESAQDDLALLQTALVSAGGYVDASKADIQIADAMREIDAQAGTQTVDDLEDDAEDLRRLLLRRTASTLQAIEVQAEIDALQAEIAQLQTTDNVRKREIVAPTAGYFSQAEDGYESIFTPAALETMTPTKFIQLSQQDPQENIAAFGKMINGFTWQFAMLTTHDQAEQMTVGQTVTLRFAQTDDLKAEVINIVYDYSDQALVVFENDPFTSEVATMRNQTVEVITKSYTGIRIPKAAITLNPQSTAADPQLGVYILTGNTSRFKPIEKVYEGENFYLVEQGLDATTGIVAGDKVITYATELSDMKVVK